MDGFQIHKARREAGVSQDELVKALSLNGGRSSMTDIEHGRIEVTDAWAYKAILAIQTIKIARATDGSRQAT